MHAAPPVAVIEIRPATFALPDVLADVWAALACVPSRKRKQGKDADAAQQHTGKRCESKLTLLPAYLLLSRHD